MSSTPYQQLLAELKITLTERDTKRLSPYLTGWPKLNELLLLGVSSDDLRKLIALEASNRKRPQIIQRLTARLQKADTARLRKLIDRCLST